MDHVTLEEALYLFLLPRALGATADGQAITASTGRFGPYVKYGSKYVSLKDDDPYTITLERALEVIRLKQEADAARLIVDFGIDDIQVLNGRYGPYITDRKRNARIPKDRDPKSMTLEECRALLALAPERGARGRNRFAKAKGPATASATAMTEGAPVAVEPARAGRAKSGTRRGPATVASPTAAAAARASSVVAAAKTLGKSAPKLRQPKATVRAQRAVKPSPGTQNVIRAKQRRPPGPKDKAPATRRRSG
jgi:DNA topoisomerase-1